MAPAIENMVMMEPVSTDIQAILANGESGEVEFKISFNAEVIATLVAFANTRGGRVYMGLADDGAVRGVSISAEAVQQWINEVKTKTSPMIIPDVEVYRVNGRPVVVFSLQEYPIKPVAFRGKYFKRVNNSNHLLSTAEVVDMHLRTFNTSWDYHLTHEFSLEDISFDKVQQAIDLANHRLDYKVADDPFTFLVKHDLVRDGAITHAAYLLFTKRKSLFTTIELGRFQTDILIKDSARSKSDVLSQIDEVIDFVKKHINKEIIVTADIYNTQRWQYPLDAIREIIHNMVIHRDYRSSSDSIVKVYDHKIEFYNPGRLPDNISEADLLNNTYRSTPRNKLLADFCRHIGMIEKYGSGIQRIIDHFKTAELPVPEFKNISEGFQVTIFDGYSATYGVNKRGDVAGNVVEDVAENVAGNEAMVMDFLRKNKYLSAKEIADRLEVAPRTVQRYLRQLQDKKLLKRVGPAKGGYWKVE